MKITIVAMGSRGDVQPGIALGSGLRRAGHQVCLASYDNFAELARQHGLDFAPMEGDITAILSSEEGQAMLNSRNPLKISRVIRDSIQENLHQSVVQGEAALAGSDFIVLLGATYYLEWLAGDIPYVIANLQPLMATREFPSSLLPPPPVEHPLTNWISHQISGQIFWQMLRPLINEARRDFKGLPAWPFWGPMKPGVRSGRPHLYAFSKHVIPHPADWPANTYVTGYWFLDDTTAFVPPPALADFLAAGPPPVYVGFGSMSNRDPEATAGLVVSALEKAGQRGILLKGWGGLQKGDLPENMLMVDSLPHSWLFPRMAGIVHHGGSGTTAAGLRAGIPAVIVPFFADQPFWARRAYRLGVTPPPLPREQLTADSLAEAIWQAVTDEQMRERAAFLGEQVRAEQGVVAAVRLIERYAQAHPPPPRRG